MNRLRTGYLFLFVLLTALSACGDEVVDFDDTGSAAAPSVTSTVPGSGAVGVAVGTTVAATFSEAMDPATLTATTFTLRQGATNVSGAVTLDGAARTATFTPAAALGAGLVYTATISTGARDVEGIALTAPHIWTFTTAFPAGVAPSVTSTVPASGAVGVALGATVSATFSEVMSSATLNTTTFTLRQGTTNVSGAVSINGAARTATFTPAAPLGASLVYTATITTGAKDLEGIAMTAAHTWTFTTAAAPAAGAPQVTSTTPLHLATDVSIAKRPTATFNEAMAPATLNATTFTLHQGLTPVAGTVTFDALSRTATFTPDAPLGFDLLYTARITTGAQDASGAALAAEHVWTFTTAACGQAPVALRSADGFVVLAGSTVTSTGATSITGDVGVSPGTAATGFPPGIIVGTLHAGTPTAAQGIADLTTAYNDAAGRTLCPITVSGNLGGQTHTPGLYKSTSDLAITSGDLTLDAQGDGDAVFIYQMASTLTTTAGRQVILTNGAKAANVFWQVGSSATLGTTSVFHGTIMADQAVTLETGARLTGRALARIAAVDLDTNVIVKPAP